MSTIRVLDLNIWNYNEPWLARREQIVRLILDTQPDIVALQEVRYQDWLPDPRHQADQILAGLPSYNLVWHPAHHWPLDTSHTPGQQWEGLAVLSPHPIVDLKVAYLSREPGDPRDTFQRLVLAAQVSTPAGPLWLFNTHYPLSGQARDRVALETLEFVDRTAGEHPFVLTGDFNAEPHDLPICFLAGKAEINGRIGHLIDTWSNLHPGEPGYTYPAWGPQQRIDYLFLPSIVVAEEIAVVGAVPSREVVSPSDHCGLLAILRLEHTGAS